MLIKYDDELKLFTYLSDLEKNINDYYIIYKEKLYNIEKNKILEDIDKINDNKKSVIYIYNIDTTDKYKIHILHRPKRKMRQITFQLV